MLTSDGPGGRGAAVRGLGLRFTGNLVVWGSLQVTDALFRAGEVDVLRLRMLPVLVGTGRSFVPSDLGVCAMSLVKAQSLPGGLVVLAHDLARRD